MIVNLDFVDLYTSWKKRKHPENRKKNWRILNIKFQLKGGKLLHLARPHSPH